MLEIGQTLAQIGDLLVKLLGEVGSVALVHALLLFWLAWATFGVNWKKAWKVLEEGAWAPLVLLTVASALVWSQLAPSSLVVLGLFSLKNFWWQLCALGLGLGLTFFCGWIQGLQGWAPLELDLSPPAAGHGHGHGDPGHGHHDPGHGTHGNGQAHAAPSHGAGPHDHGHH